MRPLAEVVAGHAADRPGETAFLFGDDVVDWRAYAERSVRLSRVLADRGLAAGERIGVLLPDGPGVHAAYLACERAGLVVMRSLIP